MKKNICITLTLLFSTVIFSQTKEEGKEKIRAYKVAYLTEKLDLTTEEAEKFWPLYTTHNKKRRELFRTEKKEIKAELEKKGGVKRLSDKEAENILIKINKAQDLKHKYRLKFLSDLKTFLSTKKILQFELSEYEFNKKMMKRLKEKRCEQ